MANKKMRPITKDELRAVAKASAEYTKARNKLLTTLEDNVLGLRIVFWKSFGKVRSGYVTAVGINLQVFDQEAGVHVIVDHGDLIPDPKEA